MLVHLRAAGHTAAVASCLAALVVPAHAGTLTGTATFRERIALPPDAMFEVMIEDIARADAPASPVPTVLGTLPASWRGDIPDAGGVSRWHLDLLPDRTYQLRQTFVGRPAPNRFDDIGRWRLEPGTNRLVLRGGREAPLFLQPIEAGNALRKLDLEGRPIISRHNDLLNRLSKPAPIDPSLHLQGMFTYLADAATIRLCATGQRLPVAMEGDYLALERAYSRAQKGQPAGRPLLANLEGTITTRPSAESGQPPRRTLVVQKFIHVWPGKGCPPSPMEKASGTRAVVAPLRGTTWRLIDLRGETAPSQLDGEQLRFGPLASTRMACPPALMTFERSYVEALGRVRRWSTDRRPLLLQDTMGRTLMVFPALG